MNNIIKCKECGREPSMIISEQKRAFYCSICEVNKNGKLFVDYADAIDDWNNLNIVESFVKPKKNKKSR